MKLAVTSAGISVVRDNTLVEFATSNDIRLLTKQAAANDAHHQPKRIFTEGVNFNKTFYKGKRRSR